MTTGLDVRPAIERIVYGYAACVDAGDFEGLAALFEHATYKGAAPTTPASSALTPCSPSRSAWSGATRTGRPAPST